MRRPFDHEARRLEYMKKALVLLVVALALPTSVAFAKSPHRGARGKSAPKVMYVLRGTLSSYQAATTAAGGQISITVNHANFHGRALRDQTLTFATTMSTKVRFRHGVTEINDGARGVLKFRAPLRMPSATDMAATLQTDAKALRIIDLSRH
jgi:hypothetical protein